ncbi:heme-binding protein [Pirellula staleyi DSM 6068]|uniref:Heme-binding protein n=1 Tax=Pirellula staleyi (strain ATCC 27377 / DSM 6068 / ICPB 4128) TaxID=530564 RepID=D2R0M2_PIRSD|nr:heme-binding protein [Pirellula staleyi DSM 6068]
MQNFAMNSRNLLRTAIALVALLLPMLSHAEEPAKSVKPIRALLITGGCCHDYTQQKKILPAGISERALVDWTIVHQGGSTTDTQIPFYENEKWYEGFDVVVHNECFAGVTDPSWTARILKAHREGVPAVVVHCAMHCYRDKTDAWFEFLGVTSHGHGANYPFDVINLEPKHPVMEGFGDKWSTPKGELYIIKKLWPTAKPLAHALSRDTKNNETVIWTNDYHGTRVFGTTIGHHNEEHSDPVFLNYMTRGLLWACDKLSPEYLVPSKEPKFDHVPDPTAKTPKGPMGTPTPAKGGATKEVMIPKNLAAGKTATASSHQQDNSVNHLPAKALDGDLSTRWCADGASVPQWLMVDLGEPQEVNGCSITWEMNERAYEYIVEASTDGKTWEKVVDATSKDPKPQDCEHKFNRPNTRYLRVTISGSSPGAWCSLYEFQVHSKELVKTTISASTQPRSIVTGGKNLLAGIKAPDGFQVTLFAAPPDVGYPTCLAASASGDVYVGVDENGSLDAKPNRGRVIKCVDSNQDGVADKFTSFASMDSPRGVVVDGTKVYVLHPPAITVYEDTNSDGVSDREERLVDGLGFDLKFRGADHTTNGMRLGIDGWLYIAVGDYGFLNAKGKDGTELQLHGGGVARVRTDGSGLEMVSYGQRNIYDVAVDPLLNCFTRDNTNDGGGWNVRLSHVVPTARYGYPSLYINFPDEIVQPLADYGGGSPCGSLFVHDDRLPAPFASALYTCDWGRSVVYRHPLKHDGSSYIAEQEPFVELPRPTDMDIDGQGNIYISSWRDGGFTYSNPNVGYVVAIRPEGIELAKVKAARDQSTEELVKQLASGSHVYRLEASRELVRRAENTADLREKLAALASSSAALEVRVAAISTLAQVGKSEAIPALVKLADDKSVREYAIRFLADHPELAKAAPADLFTKAAGDTDPRVRLAAAIAIARRGEVGLATALAPQLADSDKIVQHVAIRSLVKLAAREVALSALLKGTDSHTAAAGRVLQELHDESLVDTLITTLGAADLSPARRAVVIRTVARLGLQEAPWDGKWWGTRPDTSGPYYKTAPWTKTEAVIAALTDLAAKSDASTSRLVLAEMSRHKLQATSQAALAVKLAQDDPAFLATAAEIITAASDLPDGASRLLVDVVRDAKLAQPLRAKALKKLTGSSDLQATIDALDAVGSVSQIQDPLVQTRLEFARSDKMRASLHDALALAAADQPARKQLGYLTLLAIEADGKASPEDRAKAREAITAAWTKEAAAEAALVAIGQSKNEQYVLAVTSQLKSPSETVRKAATLAADQLAIDLNPVGDGANRVTLAGQEVEKVITQVSAKSGDAKLGMRLFARQSCVQCHTVSPTETPRGPFLGGITQRYKKHELIESIVKPSAKIAQGFETQIFVTVDGLVIEGFVTREAGDEVEIRNAKGEQIILKQEEIEQRKKGEVSVMPAGLVDKLTADELAAILAFLETLPGK